MHLIEHLSGYFGVEPSIPNITTSFIPLPNKNYITILNDASIQSNCYDYFDDVMLDVAPLLQKNGIDIIQIKSKNDPRIRLATRSFSEISSGQLKYLVKHSMLHVTTDAYTVELAGCLKTKVVNIIGNRFAENFAPWWADKSRFRILNGRHTKKPTFSQYEEVKNINAVRTETVTNAIFKMLGFKNTALYKTLFVGQEYPAIFVDWIPNFQITSNIYDNFLVMARLDKHNDINMVLNSRIKKISLLCDEPLSQQTLDAIRPRCAGIAVKVNTKFKAGDLSRLQRSGINLKLIYDDGVTPQDVWRETLDYNVVTNRTKKPDIKIKTGKTSFKTSKLIISNDQKYASYAHEALKIPLKEYNIVIDNKDFWEEADFFKIVNM